MNITKITTFLLTLFPMQQLLTTVLLEPPPCSFIQHPNLLYIVQRKGVRTNSAKEILYPLDKLCNAHNLHVNFNCEQEKNPSYTKATLFLS